MDRKIRWKDWFKFSHENVNILTYSLVFVVTAFVNGCLHQREVIRNDWLKNIFSYHLTSSLLRPCQFLFLVSSSWADRISLNCLLLFRTNRHCLRQKTETFQGLKNLIEEVIDSITHEIFQNAVWSFHERL